MFGKARHLLRLSTPTSPGCSAPLAVSDSSDEPCVGSTRGTSTLRRRLILVEGGKEGETEEGRDTGENRVGSENKSTENCAVRRISGKTR